MKKLYIYFLSVFVCTMLVSAVAQATATTQITNIRWARMPDMEDARVLRVVLDMTAPIDISGKNLQLIHSSGQINGILKAVTLAANAQRNLKLPEDMASSFELQPSGDNVKILVNLPAKSDATSLNVFVLKEDKANGKPWRLVIDIIKPMPIKRLSPADYGNVQITDVRWSLLPDVNGSKKLRVVFDMSGPYRISNSLEQTQGSLVQLQTVLSKARMAAQIPKHIAINDDNLVRSIDLAQKDKNSVQLTVNLALALQEDCYNIFVLRDDMDNAKPWRVVLDIMKPVPKSALKFTAGLKDKKIAIDPGHGGSDPGAVGPGGDYEKNVTLPIALQLKTMLEKAGATVYMSRVDDRDVCAPNAEDADELQARVDVGNKNKADIFVCIHADSFREASVGGTSTFYYPKTNFDGLLASSVQTDVVRNINLDNRGVNRANFYVLKHTNMPAILTVVAFISNPDEEKKLVDADFESKAAQGIFEGIQNFFRVAARQ